MTYFQSHKKKGFTLLEALVSIAILVTAVGGPLFIASQSISNGETARNEAVASYLAQEAIEVLRKQRDDDALASPAVWIGNEPNPLAACIFTGPSSQKCSLDPLGSTNQPFFVVCPGAGNCPFMKLVANGLYRQPGGGLTFSASPDTIYTRSFQLIKSAVSTDREIVASTTVAWSEKGVVHRYTLQDIFLRN